MYTIDLPAARAASRGWPATTLGSCASMAVLRPEMYVVRHIIRWVIVGTGPLWDRMLGSKSGPMVGRSP